MKMLYIAKNVEKNCDNLMKIQKIFLKGNKFMKVGYAVLYKDGELVISNNNYVFQKKIFINYGEFEDTEVPWKKEYDKIKTIKILNQVKSNNMKNWFKNCVKLTNLIDFNNLDVSNCKDFSYMCYNCQELIDI